MIRGWWGCGGRHCVAWGRWGWVLVGVSVVRGVIWQKPLRRGVLRLSGASCCVSKDESAGANVIVCSIQTFAFDRGRGVCGRCRCQDTEAGEGSNSHDTPPTPTRRRRRRRRIQYLVHQHHPVDSSKSPTPVIAHTHYLDTVAPPHKGRRTNYRPPPQTAPTHSRH